MSWWRTFRRSSWRILIEDALKHLHAAAWRGHPATPDSLAGALGLTQRKATRLAQRMQAHGWVLMRDGTLQLSSTGEQLALQVIRAHRLWEKYLVDEARLPVADVHAIADRREHSRSPEAIHALDAAMGHPTTDPHGDPIPTAEGRLPRADSVPLTEWPAGPWASIVHLEDEPEAVFAQIAALGLAPGQRIKVLEADERRVLFADRHDSFVLAPVVAANISVAAAPVTDAAGRVNRLDALRQGRTATVAGLDETLQGFTRRRLLDLGLTPGAAVTAEYRSFLGDPMAFRVRGSLIALRRDQARHVLVRSERAEGTGHE